MSLYQWSRLMTAVMVCLYTESRPFTTVYRDYEGATAAPTDILTGITWLYPNHNYITTLRDCRFYHYTQPSTLTLNNNLISVISSTKEPTCCRLLGSTAFQNTAVSHLSLNTNQLVFVPGLHFIAETLIFLHLGRNQFTSISSTAFDERTGRTELNLYNDLLTTACNIWVETQQRTDVRTEYLICYTRLLRIKDVAEHGVAIADFICAGPPSPQGRSFNDLTREELDSRLWKNQHWDVFNVCIGYTIINVYINYTIVLHISGV